VVFWYTISMENKTLFSSQLLWKPERVKMSDYSAISHFILGGMGGSHLGAGVLKMLKPGLNLYVHRNYGLPPFTDDFLAQGVCIASSYSGNTEEVLSFYDEARDKGLKIVVVTSGGELLKRAEKNGSDLIVLPTGFQPRDALGFFVRALSMVVGNEDINKVLDVEDSVQEISQELIEGVVSHVSGFVPVVYSSLSNLPLAYMWKIKFNETSKNPAFYNVLPELNHNEMEGFDFSEKTAGFSKQFKFIFLTDPLDDSRIIRRMNVLKEVYESKGLLVKEVLLPASSTLEKISFGITLAHLVSHKLAEYNGSPADEVPLIENFKKKL